MAEVRISPVARTALLFLLVMTYSFFAVALQAQESTSTIVLKPVQANVDSKRFALVLGNAAYRQVPVLRNSANDAAAVAAKLQGLGYEVHHAQNLDRRSMNEVLASFLARIEPGSETLVYYSGHGVELNGSNYLLPIDIPSLSSEQERMLRTEGVSLTELLLDLEARSARVTLVILDACRDNPFRTANIGGATKSLGATRGLARVDPPRGSFVIFAAGVGEQAIDNLGKLDVDPNGLFTRKLLTLIDQEGLEIRSLVQRLRTDVRQAALSRNGHSQIPSYYDQLLGEFYFRPKRTDLNVPGQNACEVSVDPQAGKNAILDHDVDGALKACAQAVSDFPEASRFVGLLQAAQEQRSLKQALRSDTRWLSDAYLTLYPQGRYVEDVKQHLLALAPPAVIKPLNFVPPVIPSPPDSLVQPVPNPVVNPVEIARVLQTELKRVRCDPGATDGTWGSSSVKALENFNLYARTTIHTEKPSIEAIAIIRSNRSNVCPLSCSSGFAKQNDSCVRIECPTGTFLTRSGSCKREHIVKPKLPVEREMVRTKTKVRAVKPAEQESRRTRATASAASSTSRCFTFNGVKECN